MALFSMGLIYFFIVRNTSCVLPASILVLLLGVLPAAAVRGVLAGDAPPPAHGAVLSVRVVAAGELAGPGAGGPG